MNKRISFANHLPKVILCLHEDRELDEQEDKLCQPPSKSWTEAEDNFLQDIDSEFNDKENLGKDWFHEVTEWKIWKQVCRWNAQKMVWRSQ